jgi:hypothetical protein
VRAWNASLHEYDIRPYILTETTLTTSFELSSLMYNLMVSICLSMYLALALVAKLLWIVVACPRLSFLLVVIVSTLSALCLEDEI